MDSKYISLDELSKKVSKEDPKLLIKYLACMGAGITEIYHIAKNVGVKHGRAEVFWHALLINRFILEDGSLTKYGIGELENSKKYPIEEKTPQIKTEPLKPQFSGGVGKQSDTKITPTYGQINLPVVQKTMNGMGEEKSDILPNKPKTTTRKLVSGSIPVRISQTDGNHPLQITSKAGVRKLGSTNKTRTPAGEEYYRLLCLYENGLQGDILEVIEELKNKKGCFVPAKTELDDLNELFIELFTYGLLKYADGCKKSIELTEIGRSIKTQLDGYSPRSDVWRTIDLASYRKYHLAE